MADRDAVAGPAPEHDSTRPGLTRRQLLVGSLAVTAGLVAGAGAYSTLIEPFWIEVVKRPLVVAGLPAELAGARLVQISDLRAGHVVPDDYLLRALSRVAALEPDILVVTGDLTQGADAAQTERIYSRLPSARLGTVCILGNHDYGAGWSDGGRADMVAGIVRRHGATVLRNEVTEIAGLQIAGMDDLWAHRFDPVRTLAALDPRAPAVCLSHNPDTVDAPGWGGFRGWVLSGHTHGGQFRLPLLPPFELPVRDRRYAAGEVGLGDGRTLYVNRGIGFLRQIRFDVRPEITVFDLHQT